MGAVIEPEPSQALARGEVSLLKIGMDRLRHGLIGRRGSGCGHMRDQVRASCFACFPGGRLSLREPTLFLK